MESFATQLAAYVIRPTLEQMGLYSLAAETLLLGTAAHESNGFRAIHQYGGGPALSLFQIEPATHDDIWTNTIAGMRRSRPQAVAALEGMVPRRFAAIPDASVLLASLEYAAAMARICYWRAPAPLPPADDIPALAAYWKRYYNTIHGAGHESEFIDAYSEHCE